MTGRTDIRPGRGAAAARTSAVTDVLGDPVLGVWAHPDDEAYLSGGLMALARDAGTRVVCVTATSGELGTADPVAWPPNRLAAERTTELRRCLDVLGVTEHVWLGHPDGGCAQVPAALAVRQLAEVIDEVRPRTVLTFGPDGITGHLDHQTVSAWVTAAFDVAAPSSSQLLHAAVTPRHHRRWGQLDADLGVYVDGYPVVVDEQRLTLDVVLDPGTLRRKVRALQMQRTQTTGLIAAMGLEQYTAWVAEEAFVVAR
jgi:LmbE family N-acetylglucosaminyl deacetylase